jgi:predicted RNA-binding protein with PUA-like domain
VIAAVPGDYTAPGGAVDKSAARPDNARAGFAFSQRRAGETVRAPLQRQGTPMNYWLFKTEPATWSWDMQVKTGAKGEAWTGVRNFQANANMKEMRRGDLGFFYHTGDEKQVVGIVEVIKEHEKDPTDETGKFGLVTVKAVERLPKPVTLAAIKADPRFADMILVKHSRLSVQPVTPEHWQAICKLGGLKAAP